MADEVWAAVIAKTFALRDACQRFKSDIRNECYKSGYADLLQRQYRTRKITTEEYIQILREWAKSGAASSHSSRDRDSDN